MHTQETNISLVGKSGREYNGKMYTDKNSTASLSGASIVCLSHSSWQDNHWQHRIGDIYQDDAHNALNHFKEREDISQLIMISLSSVADHDIDPIDDLRRQYVHG